MPELPALDCHAHLAPDVTPEQIADLGGALIFAVSRSLADSAWALRRPPDGTVLWGLGVHPASREAVSAFEPTIFSRLLPHFALVGEIGLDRRAGQLEKQAVVLGEILSRAGDAPVICSIHSSGCAREILSLLVDHPVRAPVLHWFTGAQTQILEAMELGCWFSVNAAMSDGQLSGIPLDRALPETDFPASRKSGVRRPGDATPLEYRLADLWHLDPAEVRGVFFRNLQRLASVSATRERLPEGFRRALDHQPAG